MNFSAFVKKMTHLKAVTESRHKSAERGAAGSIMCPKNYKKSLRDRQDSL